VQFKKTDMKIIRRSLLCLCLIWLALSPGKALAQSRPNLIVITTDDQRSDVIGAMSRGAVHTPGLDRLAKRSLIFTDAHAVFALCSPSRAAILTGQYGGLNGVTALDGKLNNPQNSVAHQLRKGGYQTAISGKWHLQTSPAEAGFDWAVTFYANGTWFGREVDRHGEKVKPAELIDAYVAEESARFLRERNRNKSFFLWHCTQLPHMDHRLQWPASRKSLSLYRLEEIKLPATWGELIGQADKPPSLPATRNRTQALQYGYDKPDRIQTHIQEYRAAISDLDAALAPLWKAIESEKLWEKTIVIFLGDNGWMLGEHGLTSKVLAYAPSSQIPLMIAGPGIRPGKTNRLALNIDIAPTLLALAGLPASPAAQGKSLWSPSHGKAGSQRGAFVYDGLTSYGNTPPFLAAISSRWKLIYTWEKGARVSAATPSFIELYDRIKDPDEARNLARDERYQNIQQSLARSIERHLAK
jgi:arylsulfatase A-like enzyme